MIWTLASLHRTLFVNHLHPSLPSCRSSPFLSAYWNLTCCPEGRQGLCPESTRFLLFGDSCSRSGPDVLERAGGLRGREGDSVWKTRDAGSLSLLDAGTRASLSPSTPHTCRRREKLRSRPISSLKSCKRYRERVCLSLPGSSCSVSRVCEATERTTLSVKVFLFSRSFPFLS